MKTLNGLAEPPREPTDFQRFVEQLEADPVERAHLEEARARLREELDAAEERG